MFDYLKKSIARKIARRVTREYPVRIDTFETNDYGPVQFANWENPLMERKEIDQKSIAFYKKFIKEGDFAIDIGANIGHKTIPLSLICGKTGLTMGFDPNPFVFSILQKNIALNAHLSNILAFNFAIADTDDEYYYHSSEASFCNGGISKDKISRILPPLKGRWARADAAILAPAAPQGYMFLLVLAPALSPDGAPPSLNLLDDASTWHSSVCLHPGVWQWLTGIQSHIDRSNRVPHSRWPEVVLEHLSTWLSAIYDPNKLRELIVTGSYPVLFGIVFAETGLLMGFFLPGDSLLVTAGILAGQGYLDPWTLFGLLSLAAVAGDNTGYWIGRKTGPLVFSRPKSLLFNPRHVQRAERFYLRYGGKTVVIARFVPMVRTFAPVVAGVGRMIYRRYVLFSVMGGILWIGSMTATGYFLGSIPGVNRYLHLIILAVITISFIPAVVEFLRGRAEARRGASPPPPPEIPA